MRARRRALDLTHEELLKLLTVLGLHLEVAAGTAPDVVVRP